MSKAVMTQLSTAWCGPCKMAKKYIENTYPELEYKFVDLEGEDISERDMSLAYHLKVRGVPHFAVTIDNTILAQWNGFNKAKIDELATAMINDEIKIPKEEEE